MELTPEIIAGFSASVLQQNYDGAVESPDCHMEWWALCCSKAPKVAIAAPRRHAKSTAITLAYALASVLFRDRQYVMVVSDTITQAVQFLAGIAQELANNENVKTLFGIKKFIKDAEDDKIIECNDGYQFRIVAKGSEQKLRGILWNNKRPDLILGDDLENDELVSNKERREKFKRWFYGALVPVRSHNGIIRIVGTILHEDSLLNNMMPSPWNKDTRSSDLKVWSVNKRNSWQSVKYRAHTDDFTKLLWSQRYDANWFLTERQDFLDRGLADVYSQEYLNEPIDETVSYFKKQDFIPEDKTDRDLSFHYYIAADLAISEKETADYSVFVVAAVDQNKILHIKNVIRDRLDGREIVDLIIELHKIYEPELFGIEEMQVSKAVGPFLREEMIKTGIFPQIFPLKHMGKDKIARGKSIQARVRAHTVKFDKEAEWYSTFEDELRKFPRSKHDDQVDAFAYLGMMLDSLIEAPTKEDIEEEEYQYDLHSSGIYESGRNATTGY